MCSKAVRPYEATGGYSNFFLIAVFFDVGGRALWGDTSKKKHRPRNMGRSSKLTTRRAFRRRCLRREELVSVWDSAGLFRGLNHGLSSSFSSHTAGLSATTSGTPGVQPAEGGERGRWLSRGELDFSGVSPEASGRGWSRSACEWFLVDGGLLVP